MSKTNCPYCGGFGYAEFTAGISSQCQHCYGSATMAIEKAVLSGLLHYWCYAEDKSGDARFVQAFSPGEAAERFARWVLAERGGGTELLVAVADCRGAWRDFAVRLRGGDAGVTAGRG